MRELLWPRQDNDGSAGGLRLPQAAPAELDNNFVVMNSSRARKRRWALYPSTVVESIAPTATSDASVSKIKVWSGWE